MTGLAGTSSEINTAGSEALDSSDPFALQDDLGARFSANAVFLSHIATANNYLMVYGDVRAGFVIADRIGSTLELIPNLVGANQRPTGERGALLRFRTGSEVVVPEAPRLLDVPTTA